MKQHQSEICLDHFFVLGRNLHGLFTFLQATTVFFLYTTIVFLPLSTALYTSHKRTLQIIPGTGDHHN